MELQLSKNAMQIKAVPAVWQLLGGAALALSILLLTGVGWQLVRGQAQSEQELIDRFRIRAEIGSRFLAAYINELVARETLEASAELSGDVTAPQFTRFARALGFPAAVLLDASGRLLAVEPHSTELLGRNAGSSYAHLGAALAGQVAVSNVVSSVARSAPVVGFAVPIETDHGRRVFSGALKIADTTLGSSYLRSIVPLENARVYLLDQQGATIASSLAGPQTADLIRQRDLPLSKAIASANEGRYARFGEQERFTVAPVEGTPWRLVVSASEIELLAPVNGPERWIPWVIFVALCLALAVAIHLSRRLTSLRALQFDALEKLSLTDTLTGLYNRRGHEVFAAQVLRSAARAKTKVAILYLDLDGLKGVNDKQGHEAGDRMLLRAAELFRGSFRDSDVIARLGGDEFCIVGAVPTSESNRFTIRHRLEERLARLNATCGNESSLSMSIGLTWWDPRNPRPLAELVKEADARMYENKRKKRAPIQIVECLAAA